MGVVMINLGRIEAQLKGQLGAVKQVKKKIRRMGLARSFIPPAVAVNALALVVKVCVLTGHNAAASSLKKLPIAMCRRQDLEHGMCSSSGF